MKKGKRLAQLKAFRETKRSPKPRTVRASSDDHALAMVSRSGFVKVVYDPNPLTGLVSRRLEIRGSDMSPGIKTYGLIDFLEHKYGWSVVYV